MISDNQIRTLKNLHLKSQYNSNSRHKFMSRIMLILLKLNHDTGCEHEDTRQAVQILMVSLCNFFVSSF